MNEKLSGRERCLFELGIKLATIYHQFIGTPVSERSKKILEKAIEESIKNQPFVKDVKVEINITEKNKFEYASLNEKMIYAEVVVEVDDVECKGVLKFIEEMNYPLMFVKHVRIKNKSK